MATKTMGLSFHDGKCYAQQFVDNGKGGKDYREVEWDLAKGKPVVHTPEKKSAEMAKAKGGLSTLVGGGKPATTPKKNLFDPKHHKPQFASPTFMADVKANATPNKKGKVDAPVVKPLTAPEVTPTPMTRYALAHGTSIGYAKKSA
ncbi:MAG: hypothetical protein U1F57_02980 [bacterium]